MKGGYPHPFHKGYLKREHLLQHDAFMGKRCHELLGGLFFAENGVPKLWKMLTVASLCRVATGIR